MLLRSGLGGAALHAGSGTGVAADPSSSRRVQKKRFEVLLQAPVTPIHTSGREEGGDDNEEEQVQRAASRHVGQPAPAGRTQGFLAGSVS